MPSEHLQWRRDEKHANQWFFSWIPTHIVIGQKLAGVDGASQFKESDFIWIWELVLSICE